VVFRSHFAALVEVENGRPRVIYTTTLAPELPGDTVENFSPFDRTHRIDLPANWTPGWGETTVVVTPLTQDRVIAIGRVGGPTFMDSEIARLHHLAALVK